MPWLLWAADSTLDEAFLDDLDLAVDSDVTLVRDEPGGDAELFDLHKVRAKALVTKSDGTHVTQSTLHEVTGGRPTGVRRCCPQVRPGTAMRSRLAGRWRQDQGLSPWLSLPDGPTKPPIAMRGDLLGAEFQAAVVVSALAVRRGQGRCRGGIPPAHGPAVVVVYHCSYV